MKVFTSVILAVAVLLVLGGLPALAQDVISAQSGLINFSQGPVLLNDRALQPAKGQFPQMKEQDTLRTSRGRAELLLNPGAFLRVGDNTTVRMTSTHITDSRLELLAGTVVVEAAELDKNNAITVTCGKATVTILKRGLYRLTAEPAGLKVFDGKALVESGGRRVEVTKGKTVAFDGTLALAKFNRKETDSLDLWSGRRSEYLARVNMVTARSLYGYRGPRLSMSGWGWNPAYGVYTYIPFRGTYYSPYGYYYYSPRSLEQADSRRESASWAGESVAPSGAIHGGGGYSSSGGSSSPAVAGSSASGPAPTMSGDRGASSAPPSATK